MFDWFWIALVFWLFRYTRTGVNWVSFWTFWPIPIPKDPRYSPDDVTVICPTIATGGEDLETTLRTCLATNLHELLLVTVDSNVANLRKLVDRFKTKKIRILSVGAANKRRQMCRAIPEVQTEITVFVDDDVIWPSTILPWMLAPFEKEKYGGVGTSQRLKRSDNMTGWGRLFGFLGAAYLERRNFDCAACLHIDGGLPCLSGRTVAYRTSILQTESFVHEFTHETWRGCQLNADDDNFITRWLYENDWCITIQYHKECEVQTTLEQDSKYLKQCLRWIRSNWRSNLTSLFVERHYWWSQPWTTYSVLQTTLTAWSIPYDIFIVFSWYMASREWSPDVRTAVMCFICVWTFLISKTVKLWGHFSRYPADVVFIVPHIFFGYFHCCMKLWGLFTLNTTDWGSRDGADTDNAIRMMKLPPYGLSSTADGRASETFDIPRGVPEDQLPAYYDHAAYKKFQHESETLPLMTECNA